ncbi:MAG: hypothetical protein QOE70_4368 [Chthoniobacter sp.]|jgi:hypothetical protein|nr:hypothetical protein [Chthoniobacter sp.]
MSLPAASLAAPAVRSTRDDDLVAADAEVNATARSVEDAAAIYRRHGVDERSAGTLARLHFEHHRDELKAQQVAAASLT